MIKLKSKGQVQPSQDNRENMVKKLEKGSNSTIFASQQDQAKEESLVQVKRSSMESKNKTKLSRKEKRRARTRVCFRCKDKGHLIGACPVQQSKGKSDLTGQTGWGSESPTSLLQAQSRLQLMGEVQNEANAECQG